MNNRTEPFLFPVYARADADRVQPVVDALRGVGVEVWTETQQLRAGTSWEKQIIDAIEAAAGALVFVSPSLAQSAVAFREVRALHERQKIIIPVVIERVATPPPAMEYFLAHLHQIDLTGRGGIPLEALDQIRRLVAHAPPVRKSRRPKETQQDVREVAATLASAVRKPSPAQEGSASPPKSVFIVHGHDDGLLNDVEKYLDSLGVGSVVLRRIGGPAQSLLQKFLQWGRETRFALVLLSADDFGASRTQYQAEGVGVHALQFRARQNVILELGFFYGHLGWENVFVLFKKPDQVFPNFETPSDLAGVVFDMVEESGEWKGYLKAKLSEAGFRINAAERNTPDSRDGLRRSLDDDE